MVNFTQGFREKTTTEYGTRTRARAFSCCIADVIYSLVAAEEETIYLEMLLSHYTRRNSYDSRNTRRIFRFVFIFIFSNPLKFKQKK